MEMLSVGVPEGVILEALADESVRVVGICALPRTGTRLATRFVEKAKEEKLFSDVLMPKADGLQSRLSVGERVLIRVDKVPETFDLKKIGTPPLCKIIITSQFKSVFLRMGATKIFAAAAEHEELEIWSLKEESKLCSQGIRKQDLARGSAVEGTQDQHDPMEDYDPMEDEFMTGLIHPHPKVAQVVGRTKGVNSRHDMIGKGLCLSPRQSTITITERVAANPLDSNCLNKGEKIRDENGQAGRLSVGAKANEVQKVETYQEAMLDVLKNMALPLEICLTECILFCSMLSLEYRFTKDMLVWQWIALRLIELEEEIMEQLFSRCFDKLLNMEYIKAAGYDHVYDLPKYCVGDKMIVFIQPQLPEPKFYKNMDNTTDVTKVEHLSLAFKEDDIVDFANLKSYTRLQTLIIHCSRVSHLPHDLFLELKGLKILNLSQTDIRSLALSIGDLKELRFLDVSETPLVRLPDVICCLSHLQTLKLDGCRSFNGLPERTSELVNLRHLVISVFSLLGLRLKRIGNLTKLQTLRAFFVEDRNGYHIGELKYLDKLKGSLKIWNLYNVKTKEEALEARLSNKKDLKKIEMSWRPKEERKPDEEEILEHLQPPTGIHELIIKNYNGGVFPSWISCPSLCELVSVTLYMCRFCDILPSLGVLPSLKLLEIIQNSEVIEINSFFCRKQLENHHVAFPKLDKLKLESMSKLERWAGVVNGDFPCLDNLVVQSCPKLVGLPFLSHLRSLKRLQIVSCCEFSCFPEGGLPPVLEKLVIDDCPYLEYQ